MGSKVMCFHTVPYFQCGWGITWLVMQNLGVFGLETQAKLYRFSFLWAVVENMPKKKGLGSMALSTGGLPPAFSSVWRERHKYKVCRWGVGRHHFCLGRSGDGLMSTKEECDWAVVTAWK